MDKLSKSNRLFCFESFLVSERKWTLFGEYWLFHSRSPTFCSSLPLFISEKEFQCIRSDSFGLIVHGLWPQTTRSSSIRDQPRNCRNDQQMPMNIIRRFYCLMPDEDLMQAEWEKHGLYFLIVTIHLFFN